MKPKRLVQFLLMFLVIEPVLKGEQKFERLMNERMDKVLRFEEKTTKYDYVE